MKADSTQPIATPRTVYQRMTDEGYTAQSEINRLTQQVADLQAEVAGLDQQKGVLCADIVDLRKLNADLRKMVAEMVAEHAASIFGLENDKLKAEVARLREALEHYASGDSWNGNEDRYAPYISTDGSFGYKVAREALAGEKHEG
jgi:regulator of replication initiation timing